MSTKPEISWQLGNYVVLLPPLPSLEGIGRGPTHFAVNDWLSLTCIYVKSQHLKWFTCTCGCQSILLNLTTARTRTRRRKRRKDHSYYCTYLTNTSFKHAGMGCYIYILCMQDPMSNHQRTIGRRLFNKNKWPRRTKFSRSQLSISSWRTKKSIRLWNSGINLTNVQSIIMES